MADGRDDAALAIFIDILLPGDGNWPAASAAIDDTGALLAALAETDRAWLRHAADAVAHALPESRVAAMTALEQRDGAAFRRMLHALYDAYYATEAAHAEVHRLAISGPREPSGFFDTNLLAQVIARQTGLRRL